MRLHSRQLENNALRFIIPDESNRFTPAWTPEHDVTKLDKPLRREIEIGSKRYTLVLDPQGLKLKRKGHRRGLDLRWASLAGQVSETSGSPLPPLA